MKVWLREYDERGRQLNRRGLRRNEGPFILTLDADSLNLRAQFRDYGKQLTWQAILVLAFGIPLIILVLYFGVDWSYYFDGGIRWDSVKHYFYVAGGLLGGYVLLLFSKLAKPDEESFRPYREIPLSEIQAISIDKRKLQIDTRILHQQKRLVLIHRTLDAARDTYRKITKLLDQD